MRKLALVSLAALAAAALPAAAQAQPRSGHSWGQPGQRVIVRHGGDGAGMPGMHRREFRRIDRGHVVPRFWWGPQFHVQHWQMYGFPQPTGGRRWIRYYDDALLIDDRGRVHDGRYGMDWDRYGDRWSHDERGIPAYVGDGDYRPRERDHARAEEYDERRGGWDYGEYEGGYEGGYEGAGGHHGGGCEPRRRGPCGAPRGHGGGYPAPAYGYGYGNGYGYGAATVTITETTVESGGSSYMVEEVIEEEVVRQRARRTHRRPAPARRPIRGERG
ncbi:MAG TPA: RcnB family protein [Allosphingosinicella sp.]|jgi:Ni/Co efflux regulator RcnB